jgi:2-C-methyl-D-erythritol 4-phosphate cytidylyltransferase
MFKKYKIALLLPMGGTGLRFNHTKPKQLFPLFGKKIYLYPLELCLNTKIFDEIILPCHPSIIDEIKQDLKNYPQVKIIKGGNTRQESVYKGLKHCSSQFVLIHDAVRPFLTEDLIFRSLNAVIKYKAVNTCIKSTDTIAIIDNNKITSIPNRDLCLRGQTPQTFLTELILQAHKWAIKNNISSSSDDCSLALKAGFNVYTIDGDDTNIKITTQLDITLAEQIIQNKNIFTPLKKKSSLKKKIFVIIGATGGIGNAICSLLKKENAIIIPISRNTPQYQVNIKNYQTLKKIFDDIYKQYGEIDGLINSAGFLTAKPLSKMLKKEIDETIDVNLKGLIYACKNVKIKPQGHIINIASSSFKKGRKNLSVYSSTKAAVVNFTQAIAEEYPHINVNVIAPPRTHTPMRIKNFPNENIKELLPPEKIAEIVINLLKNPINTGSIIEIKRDEA